MTIGEHITEFAGILVADYDPQVGLDCRVNEPIGSA